MIDRTRAPIRKTDVLVLACIWRDVRQQVLGPIGLAFVACHTDGVRVAVGVVEARIGRVAAGVVDLLGVHEHVPRRLVIERLIHIG